MQRNLFKDTIVLTVVKLSRSKLELFIECPRCFWLDVKHGVKRPPPAPYTINNAIDYLLKQEFDIHREKGTPHPIMERHGIDAVPHNHPEINKWRHNFTGVQYHHLPTDFLVYGAVDDVWINSKGELMVIDYKATGANQHQIYESYGRQMEIYQWLLRKNGFRVADIGYFVFARVNKGNGFSPEEGGEVSAGSLSFDVFVESYEGDGSWIESALQDARAAFDLKRAPNPKHTCLYCEYRESAESQIAN